MTKLERAKQISCDSILQESGFDIKNVSGGKNFYLSPLRAEGEPSVVTYPDNTWADYGTSTKRMDSIDLYERIYKVDTSTAIKKMLNEEYEEFEQKEVSKEPGVVVENVSELTSSTLLAYLEKERKIDGSLAKIYCKELLVRFPLGKQPNKVHKVIGFGNDRGGWEMRNKYMKIGSSPKFYTTIEGNGKECIALEGWPDFLTLLMWAKKERFDQDVFVYNSTSFLDISLPVLQKYDNVSLFLDNDDAGRFVTRNLKENWVWCKDFSYKYGGYNDLNNWWFNK